METIDLINSYKQIDMNTIAVPFKIKDLYEGLAESSGIVSYSSNKIKIQFQTKDSIIGLFKGEMHEVDISLDKVGAVKLTKRIWGCKLKIFVSDLQAQIKIPKQEPGEISLSIRRKNLNLADSFVSEVNFDIANLNAQNEFERRLQQKELSENSSRSS